MTKHTLYQLSEHCNYTKAFTYATIAAEAGLSRAEFDLGNFYLLGRGCHYDLFQVRRWYERAVSRGYVIARQMLSEVNRLLEEKETALPDWLV